jgi:hypothetical protein
MAVFLIQVNFKNVNEQLISLTGKISVVLCLLSGFFKGPGLGSCTTRVRKDAGGQHNDIFFPMKSRIYTG